MFLESKILILLEDYIAILDLWLHSNLLFRIKRHSLLNIEQEVPYLHVKSLVVVLLNAAYMIEGPNHKTSCP